MRKSSSQKLISLTKKASPIQSFERHIRAKIYPMLRISSKQSEPKIKKTSKRKLTHQYSPQFCTNPNSYQNSELISKKQSRQKIKLTKKRKKSCPKFKNSAEHIKKSDKLSQSTKQNIHTYNKDQHKNVHNSIKKNLKIKSSDLCAQFNNHWQNVIIRESVSSTKRPHNADKIQKMNQLLEKIYSVEQESSSSSKNFLKYAFGEEHILQRALLTGKTRIVIIDWLFLIAASLIINRETVHLAVHYMDAYLKAIGVITVEELHVVAAASLLLSVKQQQRQKQADLLQTICLSEKILIERQQILNKEQQILIKLNFRLKSNTIAFWVDYFSAKWDKFICEAEILKKATNFHILLRSSDGDNYRYYRQLTELSDIILFFGQYANFNKSKLSLAILYLVIRIELEDQLITESTQNTYSSTNYTIRPEKTAKQGKKKDPNSNIFFIFKKLFMQRATPIFKDPLNFNEIFNCYMTDLCQFELTEVIPSIKFISNFLDYKFGYDIDEKAFEESDSYQEFIRKMTYSFQMKNYATNSIIR